MRHDLCVGGMNVFKGRHGETGESGLTRYTTEELFTTKKTETSSVVSMGELWRRSSSIKLAHPIAPKVRVAGREAPRT